MNFYRLKKKLREKLNFTYLRKLQKTLCLYLFHKRENENERIDLQKIWKLQEKKKKTKQVSYTKRKWKRC